MPFYNTLPLINLHWSSRDRNFKGIITTLWIISCYVIAYCLTGAYRKSLVYITNLHIWWNNVQIYSIMKVQRCTQPDDLLISRLPCACLAVGFRFMWACAWLYCGVSRWDAHAFYNLFLWKMVHSFINPEPTKHSVSLVIPREAESILCGMTEMDAVAS